MSTTGAALASESRDNIVAKFARWAAASAARQGCKVRGRKWYKHLDEVALDDLFAIPPPVSDGAFREWHEREVKKLAFRASVEIGWAAKMINMLLKVHVYIGHRGDSSLLAVIHPPIDNLLVKGIEREFSLKGQSADVNQEIRSLCKLGKTISGIANYDQYSSLIEGLRLASERRKCTLFEIERLWTGGV
jgi:hypothetical protein